MGCPRCAGFSDVPIGGVHEPVPAITQFQSPELIEAIVYRGLDPAEDPRWQEWGARTAQEYAFWSRRACGMTCLQMILRHRGDDVPSLGQLMRDGLACGAYELTDDDGVHGMVYGPFVAYVCDRFGLDAVVHPQLSVDELLHGLARGRMGIVSVHKEIRRPENPSPGRGGHLALAIGYDGESIHLRNPSGHTPDSRRALLAPERFEPFYAFRGVTVGFG
ncbi:peptidase [Aeromicrobium piscarium]|uniref:Peptidase n=2 Tax=Aeromicrobium piscarium TaxID=2590901 RepID=A0A554SBJ7_9ACTN|nr:peptidase [Aeromicrobium piscarium]